MPQRQAVDGTLSVDNASFAPPCDRQRLVAKMLLSHDMRYTATGITERDDRCGTRPSGELRSPTPAVHMHMHMHMCCCACVDISRISLLMHTTSTQAVALDVVGRPALAALTMAVEAAAAPVAAAAATARRAAGPRRRVATTLLHPRRLIGRWLDASGASEALCGTTSPAGERECVAAASTPEYRHRRSRTDRVPRTASHPRGRTDTAYRARGAECLSANTAVHAGFGTSAWYTTVVST